MKTRAILLAGAMAVAGCQPTIDSDIERGKPFNIEGTRAGDMARITLTHKDGSPVTQADEPWARARAGQVACSDGETAIPDTFTLTGSGALVQVFCAEVLTTNEEIDASGLRG